MKHWVLGIGYNSSEHEVVRRKWRQHNVDFQFVDSIEEAAHRLQQDKYVCITICTNNIDYEQYDNLRNIRQTPIVVLSPTGYVEQRADYFQRVAVDFIVNSKLLMDAAQSGKDAVQFYLDIPDKGEEPLTIVTTNFLYFCLEYHSVEVLGQPVDLTPTEFDILALLITHPKRVFTYELITDRVWGEFYSNYSRKAVISHVCNMRSKMKIQPDVPDHVISVRGVGYKFELEPLETLIKSG